MENLFLKTKDNINISINWHKNGYDEVIIICPGWFMTKDSNAFSKMAEAFCGDFDVISMDFRGHGKSSGFYTFTAKETLDVEAVVDFAKKHYKKIYLIGFSLGGGLVLIHSARKNDVDKVIAVSPYSVFEKIENHMWHKNAFIPTLKKFEPRRWCSIRPSIVIHKKIKPIDLVDKISVPTLFVAGCHDKTVFPHHTESLYQKAECIKKYELFENGLHAEDLFLDEKDRFVQLCTDWLK